jgi:hypothetical protein
MFVKCFCIFKGAHFSLGYSVTVILIQSRTVGDDFHMSGISPVLASNTLRESKTLAPTHEEEVLLFPLVEWCKLHIQDPKAISEPLHTLSMSFIRWNNFNQWDSFMRACNVHKSTGCFSFSIFLKACEGFGFSRLKPL